jgi:WD40 repeat protein
MGTPLPDTYLKDDGSRYLSGTEYEYEEAITAKSPLYILVYRRKIEDARYIVTIGVRDIEVEIWDASSGDEWESIQVPARVNDVAISRDGNWIAVAGEDMNFYLFPLKIKVWGAWVCARATRSLTDKDYFGNKCPPKPYP